MPTETKKAIKWALTQDYIDFSGDSHPVTVDNHQRLVDKVCQYFVQNNIEYQQFSFDDLEPLIPST